MSSNDSLFVSKSNRRGLTLFLVITLVIIFLPRITIWLSPIQSYQVSSEEIASLSEARERFESRTHFASFYKKRNNRYKIPPRKFDPNTYTQEEWELLGLTKKQAAVVLKFCARGIHSNDQLRKIFVIPDKLFQLIKDSTMYPQKSSFDEVSWTPKMDFEDKLVLIDVNRASEEDLDKIPGIGSFYAKNILNYRNKLGGFVKKEQLLEVWKMDPVKFTEIERFIYIDPKAVQTYNINEVPAELLRKHPYLNWSVANSIVKMRLQKKTFHSIDELKESVLIDEELFEKIKPYLTL